MCVCVCVYARAQSPISPCSLLPGCACTPVSRLLILLSIRLLTPCLLMLSPRSGCACTPTASSISSSIPLSFCCRVVLARPCPVSYLTLFSFSGLCLHARAQTSCCALFSFSRSSILLGGRFIRSPFFLPHSSFHRDCGRYIRSYIFPFFMFGTSVGCLCVLCHLSGEGAPGGGRLDARPGSSGCRCGERPGWSS